MAELNMGDVAFAEPEVRTYLTVSELRKALEGLPDSLPILCKGNSVPFPIKEVKMLPCAVSAASGSWYSRAGWTSTNDILVPCITLYGD